MSRDRLARSRIFPEFALFESAQERRKMVRQFDKAILTSARMWFSLVLVSTVVALLLISSGLHAWLSSLLPPWARNAVVLLLSSALLLGIFNRLYRKPFQRFLREQLIAKGVPICLRCGYDLRGQVEARCPECGKAFDSGLLTPGPAGESESGDSGPADPSSGYV